MSNRTKGGGKRAKASQNATELGTSGALSALILSFIPAGELTAYQMGLAGIVVTAALGTLAKILRDKGILPELN